MSVGLVVSAGVGLSAAALGLEIASKVNFNSEIDTEIDRWQATQSAHAEPFGTDEYDNVREGITEAVEKSTFIGEGLVRAAGIACVTAAINGANTLEGHTLYEQALQQRKEEKASLGGDTPTDTMLRQARESCTVAAEKLKKETYIIPVNSDSWADLFS